MFFPAIDICRGHECPDGLIEGCIAIRNFAGVLFQASGTQVFGRGLVDVIAEMGMATEQLGRLLMLAVEADERDPFAFRGAKNQAEREVLGD